MAHLVGTLSAAGLDRREAHRTAARIPALMGFREKWRIALAHVRAVQQAGVAIDAVVADTAYGQVAAFRIGLERLGLRYVVAVPYYVSARVTAGAALESVAAIATGLAPAWHRPRWVTGTKGALVAPGLPRFASAPAKSRVERWLRCEESLVDGERQYYFSKVDPRFRSGTLVTLALSQWGIEVQYREFKTELGLDHFDARNYPGWHHRAVLATMTFLFPQQERRRRTDPLPKFPDLRNLLREVMAALSFIERPAMVETRDQFSAESSGANLTK